MINDVKNVLQWIQPGDSVLDVGGGEQVFPRANAVIDLVPYSTRKHTSQTQEMAEAFTEKDWYVGDICSDEVWKHFSDKSFDFIVCSHTLEDIRDPIFVCKQLIRIGKAGYIEVPSRFREGVKGSPSSIVSGWEHHRWIIDVLENGTITFTMKHPFINHFDFLGEARRQHAFNFFFQFTGVHWVGSFNFIERGQKGSPLETENMSYFYDHFDYNHPTPIYEINNVPFSGKTFEWTHDLPIEKELSIDKIVERHNKRLLEDLSFRRQLKEKIRTRFFKRR